MNKISRFLLFSGILIVVVGIITSIGIIKSKDLPQREIQDARNAICEAKKVRAHIYPVSGKTFYLAENLYDSAMFYWKKENERFILIRDYKQSIVFADSAVRLATLARGKAIRGSAELKRNLLEDLSTLKKEAEMYAPFIRKLPLQDSLFISNSNGVMLITEAEIAYANGNFVKSSDLLKEARQILIPTYLYIEELLSEYFLQYPEWKNLANKTVEDSRKKKSYAILVDKFARECILYYNGKPKYHFTVELGKNWIGDKHHRGDKATPEGLYRIIDKKEGRHTSYYKALLLNYPNDEDIKRYRYEIENGLIHKSTSIGGHIEIHGNGGKGVDWTEGCIALSDNDMDKLYKHCRSGTPVLIIGSLKPLHEILR